jgi:hypothetical protein
MDPYVGDIEILKKQREHLSEWIVRHQTASEAAPIVKAALDTTDWQLNALQCRPPEAQSVTVPGLSDQLKQNWSRVEAATPLMPKYDLPDLRNAAAFAASGSVMVNTVITTSYGIGTPDAIAYAQEQTRLHQALQLKQGRPEEVRGLIQRLGNTNTLQRFDRARSSYEMTNINTGTRSAAAGEIRTLLEGVKGNLFDRARKLPKENMTWATMAERLSKGDRGIQDQLDRQGEAHGKLNSLLSEILKDREGGKSLALDLVWTQVLDHLFSCLQLAH